jgi:hypothetical protein
VTLLVEKIVGKDNLIPLSGVELQSGEQLWSRALGWMERPATITEQTSQSTSHRFGGEASGKAGVPLLADVSGKTSLVTNCVALLKRPAALPN